MKLLFFDLETTGVNPCKNGIQEATGKTVHIAEPYMTINFDKTPF